MDLVELKSALAAAPFQMGDLPAHVTALCEFISPWQCGDAGGEAIEANGTYQSTAAMGYALAAGKGSESTFLTGAEQLAGRVYFTRGRAARFEIDGVALLGIALGYRTVSSTQDTVDWLMVLLDRAIDALASDPWQASLVCAAKAVLSEMPDWNACHPTLSVSLRAALGEDCAKPERDAAWQGVVAGIGESDPVRRAALQGVFDVCAAALARLPVNGAGLAELIEVLEGIAESMSHWTYEQRQRVRGVEPQKWEIQHEYHVQNLLWTVLRPIFPDLVDEESLKKLGHTTPRCDLGVPSLHIIIEVKYMRSQGQVQLKKITDEVAADRSLYLRDGTGYTSMVVFIWDECRQTEEYKTLRDGLESLTGIEKVIVLPRPARMGDNTSTD
ncbi:MAG: hypothetical protein ACRBM6_09635 [Geminicoccales bacterium]